MKLSIKYVAFVACMSFLLTAVSAQVGGGGEGAQEDNFAMSSHNYRGYHNSMQDSSDQLQPNSTTRQNWNLSDVFGDDYRVYDSRDSTPGPDNWGLSKYMNASIGNRGDPYLPGTRDRSGFYYQPDLVHSSTGVRQALMEEGVDKRDKVFGNSIAVARDFDNDGQDEGVWEDPDDWSRSGIGPRHVPPEFMNFSYGDITGFDKGMGVDNGTDDEGVFRFKNNNPDSNVSIGDIAFVDEDGKSDTFEQEPPVCGDDHKEYLIEELGESANSMNRSGSFACSGRRDVCVARHGGSKAVYRNGDLVNTDEASEQFGRAKNDREVCETRGTNTRFGVWYDQDYSVEYCQNNTLYGNIGVRWFDSSFVDRHPYAVIEGIDDDMNPYLYNRNRYQFTSTQGDPAYGAGDTPVPTGRNVSGDVASFYSEYKNNPSSVYNDELKDYVASKGFCAGDDSDENLIVQESDVSVIDTNFSVIAVADSPGDCVLDGANYPNKIDQSSPTGNRNVYSTGESVSVDLGPTQRQVTCYNGVWRAEGPVFFLRENVEVESGSSSSVDFQLINVQNTETTFEVTLDVPTDLQPHTEFSQGGVQFTATLPAEETNVYGVDIFGYNKSVDSADINVTAEATGTNIQGSDHTTLDIVDQVRNQGVNPANQTANEVPGIGFTQLLVLAAAAYLFYVSRIFAS